MFNDMQAELAKLRAQDEEHTRAMRSAQMVETQLKAALKPFADLYRAGGAGHLPATLYDACKHAAELI